MWNSWRVEFSRIIVHQVNLIIPDVAQHKSANVGHRSSFIREIGEKQVCSDSISSRAKEAENMLFHDVNVEPENVWKTKMGYAHGMSTLLSLKS